jgi:hypothetical protein
MISERDELRRKCIKAMGNAYCARVSEGDWEFDDLMVAAFDALQGIACVVPAEPTTKMQDAGYSADAMSISACWRAMAEAGDLTNGSR